MMCMRSQRIGFVAALILFVLSNVVYAQAPDYEVDKTEQDLDSLAAVDYPYIFPLFGQNVVRKGFDLPLPLGINLNYYQHSMGVVIDSLSIGLDDSPMMPVEFVEFDDVTNKARTINARLDLWLFPFLNIYGLFGYVEADAGVTLSAPFPLETTVEMDGYGYGGGAILAFGLHRFRVTANGNISWSDLNIYDDPVRAIVGSFRLGRSFPVMNNRRLDIWLGAMNQNIQADVIGALPLADIIPPEVIEDFQDYQNQPWYQDLNPVEQQFIDAFVQTLQQNLEGATLTYEIAQHPEDSWNMLAGAQLELSKRWYLQAEAGFLGSRTSFMMNVNYRLPL